MLRPCFAVIILILMIIPHEVNAFFRQDVTNIAIPRNITCRSDDNETSTNDFQFCAIRIYEGLNGTQPTTFTIYNGLRYLNTFRQLLKSCIQTIPIPKVDVGSWNCDIARLFETVSALQVCVCATDNCNQNYSSCENSVRSNNDIPVLFDFMPSLINPIQCDDTLSVSNVCQEHPFINISFCEAYVRNNSVLCAIIIDGTQTIQTRLIYENYEKYLSEKLYQAKSALLRSIRSWYNETDTTVYYKYLAYDPGYIEECACMSYPLCNQNINTCLSPIPLQIDATMPTSSSTNNPSATFTSEYFSSTLISTSAVITSIDSTTANTYTGSMTTITSMDSTTATTYASSMTTITSIGSTAATTHASSMITITSMDSTVATTYASFMTSVTAIGSTTATTYTGSMTTITYTESTTATTHTGPTTAITSIVSTKTAISSDSTISIRSTDSITAILFTDSITKPTSTIPTMTAVSPNSTTTASTTTLPSPITTSSSVIQSYVTGEPGLGRSATAGIACGIIFSAVIFTAEIVFFKFFYSGNIASGFERSVAYRA